MGSVAGAGEGACGEAVRARAAQVPPAAAGHLHQFPRHCPPQSVPDHAPGRHEAALPGAAAFPDHVVSRRVVCIISNQAHVLALHLWKFRAVVETA